MATPFAHAFRNLNCVPLLDYIPTYAQLEHRPYQLRLGPVLWLRQPAIFDLFHKPRQTTKYMALHPSVMRASLEILANHIKRTVTLGSYNYYDFRYGVLGHVRLDVFPFSRWGRCLWEHTDVEVIRALVKEHGQCAAFLTAFSRKVDDPKCAGLLRSFRHTGETVHAVLDGWVDVA